MKCIVTGAAGFIGSHLCDDLLSDGHEVIGIDAFTDYYPRPIKERNVSHLLTNSKFKLIEGDLRTLDLEKVLDGAEWIFHQAGQPGVRPSWGKSFDKYVRLNIDATQSLLEVLKTSKTLKKLVFASTSSVYGDAEAMPTPETILPKPVSPYGVTKLAAEHLAHLYQSQFGVPVTSLRYFTVYGPRQRPDMAFNIFSRSALTGEKITIFGDGAQSRDFSFVKDITRANIQAAKDGKIGEVYNLGGGEITTVNQIMEMLEKIVGKKINVERVTKQIGEARNTSADTSKAKKDFGFDPKVKVYEGLKAEVDWMKSIL